MEKTTIVLMGYNLERITKNQDIIFSKYDSYYEYIDKIIFIWNNQTISIPPIRKTKNIKQVIIKANRNSLCNRHFLVYKYVETNSVLIVDDDIVLEKLLVKDLILEWKKHQDDIIGSSGRCYDQNGNYYFENILNPNYKTLTIGQTMMYHKKYMLYFEKHKELHKIVDQTTCDDLVFQIMIHSLNSKNCSRIVNSKGKTIHLNSTAAVSSKPNWGAIRSKSIKDAIKYFSQDNNKRKLDVTNYNLNQKIITTREYLIIIFLIIILLIILNLLK